MRLLSLVLALSAVPVRAAAPSLESRAVNAFADVQMPHFKFVPAKKPVKPFYWDPKARPFPGLAAPGLLVARMGLAAQLDRHHYLLRLQLGSGLWDVGVAGDAAFKSYYLTFKQGDATRVAPVGELKRLLSGIDIEIQPGLLYNFKLSPAIFDPLRRSTLTIRPAKGTRGPSHSMKVGAVIDAVKRQAFIFSSDGHEYWGFYGTDVERQTGLLSGTKSLLFVHYNSLDTKAWPLAEAALPEGQAMHVELNSSLLLTREASILSFFKP